MSSFAIFLRTFCCFKYFIMAEIEQYVTGQDGLDKLKLVKASMPKPGANEVLVKIHSVALNYRDVEGIFDQTFL